MVDPRAQFIIVGEGRLRSMLEGLAVELEIDQSVSFLGMRKDIPAIMAAIDVLVLSSLYEGLPLTLLEGMAAARPVVSTAVNGVKGIVVDGGDSQRNGFFGALCESAGTRGLVSSPDL